MSLADTDQFGPGDTCVIGQPVDIKPVVPDPEAFPLDKLPTRLADAVKAITDIVQVPVSLAAQSVIGACALVAQTRIMVEVPTRETVPPSLFLFTIAASGDRKTTADKLALGPVYDYERELRRAFEPMQLQFTIDKAAYEAAMSKAKRDGGKDRLQVKRNMEACGTPPAPPALPMLLVEDPTIEGVTKLLDEAYPSIGLFSDEGAKMLGGYSMQEERQASSGAALSQLWDGKPIKRVRGTDVTKILDGRRVSVHLMVQPGVAMKLFGNKALRDQGMLSRMLVTFPKSLKGSRLWKEPAPETWEAVEAYHKRLSGLLRQSFSRMDPETRQLDFNTVALQPEARAMWIDFSDMLERQQGPDQALAEVSDLASKMAQHALRLAAVISFFENGDELVARGISPATMRAGIALGEFYLSEAIRLFNAGSIDEDSENAAQLVDFIRKERLERTGQRWLSRNGPKPVRPAKVLQRAIDLLVEQGHLRRIEGGGECMARGKTYFEKNAFTVIYPETEK